MSISANMKVNQLPQSKYLEKEIVYGPDLLNDEKQAFYQRLEDYYSCFECCVVSLLAYFGIVLFIVIFIIFPVLRPLLILHLFWIYYDRDAPHSSKKQLIFTRKLKAWKYRRDYFPVRMVKTAELPSDTTYLMASFPHGILVFGATTNFMSDVNHFNEAYPGINPHIMTLNTVFRFPITRELFLTFGCGAVSEKGILSVLKGPPGNACVVIVGGIAEALFSKPGIYTLVLKNRKGFVRLALKAGSSLVPVFSFGETYTYDQLSNKWYIWLQTKLKEILGFPFVMIRGQGIFTHIFRLFPYKTPITTVVGKPIKLPKEENPSQELIDKYHQIFVEEITHLFHKYKYKYDINGEKATLSIV